MGRTCSGPGVAPADHGIDGILHWELQLGGGPAGPGGAVLTGGRGGALAGAPEEEAGYEGAQTCAWPCSPAHVGC